jgi:hemolysin activation/secretion protein
MKVIGLKKFKIFLYFVCLSLSSYFVSGEDDATPKGLESFYPVTKIFFKYGNVVSGLPNLNDLDVAYIEIEKAGREYSLLQLRQGLSSPIQISESELFKLSEIPLHFLKKEGYEGVVALVDPSLIDPVNAQDLRKSGNNELTIEVWVSVLESVELESDGLRNNERLRVEKSIQSYVGRSNITGSPVKKRFFTEIKQRGNHSSRFSQVILSAGSQPGMVKAVVRNKRQDSDHFSLSVSNSGSPSTGKWIFNGLAKTNQLTGIDDSLQVNYSVSNTGEKQGLSGHYYIPFLPQEKLGLGLSLGYSSYDASTFAITQIDFNGQNLYADIALSAKSKPLEEFGFRTGFEIGLRIENVKAFNSLTSSSDVSMLTPRISANLEQKNKHRYANTSISLGGNILSIDQNHMLSLGGLDVTDRYARLTFSHLENLFIGKMLYSPGKYLSKHSISMKFQSSWGLFDERHLPHHQFVTGGTGSVRGYPESTVAGDHGNLISIEYRLPFFIFGHSSAKAPLIWSVAPFVDWARNSVNNPLPWESNHILIGTGLSFYLPLPYGMFASVEFAKPLREIEVSGNTLDGTTSGDYRVHGNIGWKF